MILQVVFGCGVNEIRAFPPPDHLEDDTADASNVWITLPETNGYAPENRSKPKGKDRLPTINFQVRTVSFSEGIYL